MTSQDYIAEQIAAAIKEYFDCVEPPSDGMIYVVMDGEHFSVTVLKLPTP